MAQLTNEVITAAIEGFEAQKTRIDGQIAELRSMLSGGPTESAPATEGPGRKGRKMSAAGRARIAEAQRKRWAAAKKQSGGSVTTAAAPIKRKRRLSAAGRKAISEATKKRWALHRAQMAKAK